MKLNPNQKQIVDYLSDREWHCMANPGFYLKDDRTRISELNKLRFIIIGTPCDGRCGVKHNSRVKMRRLLNVPAWYLNTPVESYLPPRTNVYHTIGEYCCGDRLKGLNSHSKDCPVQVKQEIKQRTLGI